VGSWAEYVVVDQTQVVPIPDGVSLEAAALIGCGVITGVGAVINTAQVEAGSSVVVIGLGGVGINAVQGALLAGARHIIAVDILEAKLEKARSFGATHVINAGREDPIQVVKDLTAGRGADYVFVTVGNPKAVTQSFDMIRKRGTSVLIGLVAGGGTAPLPVSQIALSEARVIGSFLGSARMSVMIPQLLELYQQGRLKLDELITGRYPLDQINEAIAIVDRGEAVRNIIVF
jgi:Zn-dependent alcohol dehydrogenase